jgi:hypothetical protein
MDPTDPPATSQQERLAELRTSAKGWHGVQLAALGFIGLCGVLQKGESSDPLSLQALAGILVLAAFACACLGIYFVGKAAWPLYGSAGEDGIADQSDVDRASHELRRGLVMTFVSIALVALATTTSWWPTEEDGGSTGSGQVQVQASSGESFCGTLAEPQQAGTLRIVAPGSQPVDVELARVASLRLVDAC